MLIHEDIEAVLYFFTELDGGLGVLLLIEYGLAALLEDVRRDAVTEENVHWGIWDCKLMLNVIVIGKILVKKINKSLRKWSLDGFWLGVFGSSGYFIVIESSVEELTDRQWVYNSLYLPLMHRLDVYWFIIKPSYVISNKMNSFTTSASN